MEKMKKSTLVLMALASSFALSNQAHANTGDLSSKWSVNGNGLALTLSASGDYIAIHEGDNVISFVKIDSYCLPSSFDSEQTTTLVNEQAVKMSSYCFNKKIRYMATSAAGLDFVFNEFSEKTSVKVFSNKFSAIGFSDSIKEAENKQSNAI